MIPKELLYTEQHEWIKTDDDIATVGITSYAQQALGDITFVELPSIGQVVAKGAEAASLESCKAAAGIYAPAAGKVVQVNTELENKPGLINSDPFGRGWIFKLTLTDKQELASLMRAEQYADFLGGRQ